METATTTTTSAPADEYAQAVAYLTGFLNKVLHVHIADGRMFVGHLKCTDHERNLILAVTHEYRLPSEADIKLAREKHASERTMGNFKVNMKKRFVGLVVVPGEYITKIEVED